MVSLKILLQDSHLQMSPSCHLWLKAVSGVWHVTSMWGFILGCHLFLFFWFIEYAQKVRRVFNDLASLDSCHQSTEFVVKALPHTWRFGNLDDEISWRSNVLGRCHAGQPLAPSSHLRRFLRLMNIDLQQQGMWRSSDRRQSELLVTRTELTEWPREALTRR